eukprot:CAMPEP_0172360374 /NCGR_PEP_ID=MMETSP1060-20121228/4403_1 /TAXON_ID=37318 /ORGANISM="Pseudo-nitzschia pungens, Strain cf. cingulata" /LENGTH=1265 /DNA_ID=CAMNT_0013082351 /DNA_START=182 /DNA_END=3979 /DNA_ORIENTATION=-
MNSSTKNNAFSIVCLLFMGALRPPDQTNAFIAPNHPLGVRSRSSEVGSSDQKRTGFLSIDTKQFATVDRNSMATSVGMGKQKVLFQKVIRPTQNMPDILFLGYLIEYLEKHFVLPSDLPMIYDTMAVGDDDENENEKENQDGNNRYTLAWDSPLSPSAGATRMEVEVVGIYTDDKKKKDQPSASLSSSTSSSVPNMAMVVVRRPNDGGGDGDGDGKTSNSLPPMMRGLFDDSEKRIIQALDRGLDDFVAGKIKFDMDDDDALQRQSSIPANVKTAQEAIEAELVDDYPTQKDKTIPAEDVVFDAYATTDLGDAETKHSSDTTKTASKTTKPRTRRDVDDAKARAMATMQKPADEVAKTKTPPKTESKTGVDFAVEAAKKAAAAAAARSKSVQTKTNNDDKIQGEKELPSNESAAHTVDFAVAAARKAAELRKKKKSLSTESKEDLSVAAARKMAAASATPKTKRKSSSNTKSNKVRGKAEVISSETRTSQTQTAKGPSMPPIPEGWKPRDYFKDQRAFSGVISRPKKAAAKATQKVTSAAKQSPPKATRRPSTVAAKIASQSKDTPRKAKRRTKPDPSNSDKKESVEKRKLNAKIIDGSKPGDGEDDFSAIDPLPSQSTGNDANTPSKKEIEMEIMKAAQTALDEIEAQGSEMTSEDMLKDILKFDEETKKEEQPGSGFVSGAFEKAKELMKDRHRQIKERKKQQQQQKEIGFKEFEKPDANAFPRYPNPTDSAGESDPQMTPEEELRAMFAAGQKIADGKIDSNIEKADVGGLKKQGTTEEDVDRLIAEEKTVSKYGRILDDELAELEVRINSSPGEELDGPMQNPMFDIMSGPEVYNPNVELDAVNYPGAMPGTADVKLPKELNEAMKQAEFAASVLMSMETKETKDENTGETTVQYFSGKKELSTKQVQNLQKVVTEASKSGIIDNPVEVMKERSRLQILLNELWDQPEERSREIASNYIDLLLSDRFVGLIRERLTAMADRDLDALRRDDESLREPHEKERNILGQLVVYAQALLKETRALGAELEAHQLEIVRSICKVAMDPAHTTEEETANALSDAVRDMRPLLDDAFVAYLKYAVAEEEAKLARAGLLDDPDYNQWLFVLKIVQQGVYAEIAKGINRYIEHIWYVIRMDTPQQRRRLLENLIDDMPTMDVRPFVQVVDNIVGSLGDGVNGNFDGVVPLGEMTNTLLQLQHDVQEILPPERIAEKARDADEWAARQKKRLMEQRKIGQQRLEAAKQVGHLENDVDAMFGSGGGEVDRFD